MSISNERILVGVTGASGVIYAERLVQVLLTKVERIYLVITETGRQVVKHELRPNEQTFSLFHAADGELRSDEERKIIRIFRNEDLFAPIASGSSVPSKMIILPCSMGTAARINQGISSNLLERAADVCLKQAIKLIICPRETPFNTIHLTNLLNLSRMGVQILPAMPAFYQHPRSMDDLIDFIVGRSLEALNISHDLYRPWNSRMR